MSIFLRRPLHSGLERPNPYADSEEKEDNGHNHDEDDHAHDLDNASTMSSTGLVLHFLPALFLGCIILC